MDVPEIGATLRSFVSRSGALEAAAVVEEGVVRCDGSGAVTLERDEEIGPEPLDWRGARAAELGFEPKRLPPFEADVETGEVTGPLGGLEHVALGALAVARAIGGVAVTWVPTTDETELVVSAREGEGVVIVVGEEYYEMDESWPPERPAP